MERLMLLDGNGLIYRGYFALINVPLSTSKGELVNAVFGFSNIVLRGFQDVRPDYVAIAFDLPAPTFRHEQYAEYKATRRPMPDDLRAQFPKVREVVAALRLPVYQMAGFEADDVIGTLTRQAEARDLETTIVTGDLDMLQLVTERTRLMTTRRGWTRPSFTTLPGSASGTGWHQARWSTSRPSRATRPTTSRACRGWATRRRRS